MSSLPNIDSHPALLVITLSKELVTTLNEKLDSRNRAAKDIFDLRHKINHLQESLDLIDMELMDCLFRLPDEVSPSIDHARKNYHQNILPSVPQRLVPLLTCEEPTSVTWELIIALHEKLDERNDAADALFKAKHSLRILEERLSRTDRKLSTAFNHIPDTVSPNIKKARSHFQHFISPTML